VPRSFVASLAFCFAVAVLPTRADTPEVLPAPREVNKGKQPAKKSAGKEPTATPVDTLKVAKDFKVELLYSVPKETEGSWVSMCVDPKGRLIVSDQEGGLFRVTPAPIGGKPEQTKIEKIPVEIGDAQGLLWAFDSLYVVVNSRRIPSGLYRVTDTNKDDILDKVELLHKLVGGQREHGPHAVLLNPDGKSLTVVCGNQEPVVAPLAASRVPKHWGEDHLLPRMPDGRGFMAGVLGPGGCMYKVDKDGKNWELLSTGYRNQYDAAYNKHGDLFTYDADMEWDFNTPWYRPTRVLLAASGADYGWRNGAGKWPSYYADSLPSIVDIGPGSPTGVTFGYGAKFPAKYQDALFICDWSYGKLYAVHLAPEGSAYRATVEEFVTGSPLPLTDVVIDPKDGAMYFTIGGRKTKSGLYRVTYSGKEFTGFEMPLPRIGTLEDELRAARTTLELAQISKDANLQKMIQRSLASDDRFVRAAARTALEHQDAKTWMETAFAETNSQAALEAMLALVRVSSSDPQHKKTPVDEKLKARILDKLATFDWAKLSDFQKLELLRVYSILFVRMGPPDDAARKALIEKFDAVYPAKSRFQNADLCQLLVYLQAPSAAGKTMKLLADAATQEEQMEYAKSLRMLKAGWTPALREDYFKWFNKASRYKGGNSYEGFVANIKKDAIASLTMDEKTALQAILSAAPETTTPMITQRPLYKQWKMEELTALLDRGLVNRDFDNGRKMFAQANCFACHRFDGEGGAHGPDLSQAAGRFSVRDLLESTVEPSKSISDQYAAVIIEMDDGRKITGRIINLKGDEMVIMPNMMEPNTLVTLNRRLVESVATSKLSLMPTGLLDTLNENEVLDLMAYLLSRGERGNKMFKKD
jgi:putative heme-binding domain-containing protein